MRRWVPHIHYGGTSGECTADEAEGGREGYYFEVCWFGWQITFAVSSLRWERQDMAEVRARYSPGGTQ